MMNYKPIRGIPLFVRVMGHGYPLVLMHGGPGQDHASLLPLQSLAEEFTLVFYDHRCNGRSEGADLTSMTWENLTADAEALRQCLGFDQWAVLGHSFGGMVALEYALRYPKSLSHLLLMDTCGDANLHYHAPEILAKRGYRASAVQAARRFYKGQVTPGEYFPTVMKFSKAYFYHFSLLGLIYNLVFGPRVKFRPEATIFGFTHLYPGWTVMDRLSEIQVPSLVLAGRYDFLFPPEHQAILADRLPNARLEIIEHAGHNPHDEQTAEVQRLIRKFLADENPSGT
jgi:proline-specific peptidase